MPVLRRNPTTRNSSDDPEEFRAPLSEHLEELRTRIIRSVALLVVGWILGWFLEPYLYAALNSSLSKAITENLPKGAQYSEAFRNATEMFMLKLRLSFMLGLAITFPLILLQMWAFVAPGLKRAERQPLQRLAPYSVALFGIGAFFAYLILPSAFRWFIAFLESFPGTSLIQEPGSMVFFSLKMMLAFGIAFQLPLIVFMLGKLGLLTAEALIQYWRQAVVVIFFASAALTPGADPISMFMMAVPLVILFAISVYAVKITTKLPARDPALNELD